jgi:hypothetical protein
MEVHCHTIPFVIIMLAAVHLWSRRVMSIDLTVTPLVPAFSYETTPDVGLAEHAAYRPEARRMLPSRKLLGACLRPEET